MATRALGVGEIETALDALEPRVDPVGALGQQVDPAIEQRDLAFQQGQPGLHLAHVGAQLADLAADRAQEFKNHVVGRVGHPGNVAAIGDRIKAAAAPGERHLVMSVDVRDDDYHFSEEGGVMVERTVIAAKPDALGTLDELAGALQAMTWQPMATAPKDGTVVILACAGKALLGYWRDVQTYHYGKLKRSAQCWAQCGAFTLPNDEVEPDAWMPMPEVESLPPKTAPAALKTYPSDLRGHVALDAANRDLRDARATTVPASEAEAAMSSAVDLMRRVGR